MRVTIRGKAWKVERVDPGDGDIGHCDPPTARDRVIKIAPKLRGRMELDVALHEFLHAAYWDLDENAVEAAAEDIAAALWKMGYRKKKP